MYARRISLIPILFFLSMVSMAQTPVELNGKLSVLGVNIVNERGQVVSFSGNSFFWSNTGWEGGKFYTKEVVGWLKEDWHSTIVRAAMGVEGSSGYLGDASNKARAKAVVDGAIENGIYVLIDWHSHHAEDYTAEAVTFFKEMATLYGEYPNVIYEIYNEPLNISWNSKLKPYAETVIQAIREIDPDNLIVVGTPNWSQDVDVASKNPITGYSNIVYALHFYAGSHGAGLRNKAKVAIDNGLALMVTEWGTVNSNGDGSVDQASCKEWKEFMTEHGITNVNWSVCDKNEGASIVKAGASTAGNWTDSQLTSSGLFVRNFIRGWESAGSNPLEIDNSSPILSVYPIPFKDEFKVQFQPGREIKNVNLLNIKGQVIRQLEVNGESELLIKVDSQEKLFLLQVVANSGKVFITKLVKE